MKNLIIKNKNLTVANKANRSHRNETSTVSKALLGLAMCSVFVVTQAADSQFQGKPAFTMKIEPADTAMLVDGIPQNTVESAADGNLQGTVTNNETEFFKKAVVDNNANNRSIRLKDGGVVWVTKDPTALRPTLNVSAPQSIKVEQGKFDQPMSFEITSNYAHYIDSWELNIYHGDDEQQKRPLATFAGRSLANDRSVKWNGVSKSGKALQQGDKLNYVLTVKDKQGHIDQTHSRELSLIGPQRFIKTVDNTSKPLNALENNLSIQTIPVYGSRVRIFGRDIPSDNSIMVDGKKATIVDNKFVMEKLLPVGRHDFNVAITDSAKQSYSKPLSVDLKSRYMFMIGLADITVGEGKVSGNLETLSDGDKYLDGDLFVDGRLAFYLKGKIKGKYLVTAQMDTGTADIDELFDDIHKKDSSSVFSRLDPDKYYPVYGDDSTITDDTNSQGKMYVRVDWDKSRAIWGNYNTDITGTELSSFNRSLYGAKLNHKSTKTTSLGEHKTDFTVFGSESQSAFRHNEFLGTGGSLYYLKDKDIVDGSEKIWVEIRESGGDRVISKVTLEEGRDYQIDDYQGRIILNRALLQIAEQEDPSLIKDTPLDGDQVYLMVDYEYVPDDFDSDQASFGGRGKVWVNDHFAVGGTYIHEDREGGANDYDLKGVDVTLRHSKGTYIKGEYAESQARQTEGSFISTDGGLNFEDFASNAVTTNTMGTAYSVEARADLNDFTSLSGSIGAWFKERDADFSSANLDTGTKKTDLGVQLTTDINNRVSISAKATQLEKEDLTRESAASLQANIKVSKKLTFSGELRQVKEEDLSATAGTASSTEGEGTLGAFKVGYDLNKDVNLYAITQSTIDKSGAYENNDLITLGVRAAINKKLDINAELSSGDRGEGATVGLGYKMTDSYSLYTNFTQSTDSTDNNKKAFTVGQRKSVSNQLKVYTEHQFTYEDTQSGVGHTFGIDYKVSKEITATASAQSARLDNVASGLTDRDAFSVGLSYKEDRVDASTRLEFRRDTGSDEDTQQWVTTNNVNYRVNPSMRLQGKLNHSMTEDQIDGTNDAQFTEASVGFAYRPINHDRLNVLGRLTYLYDLEPLEQSTEADERSLITSVEATYQLNKRWELGGKLAHKESEIRADRDTGDWSRNDATLASARLRYHLNSNWDAMAQYHWLNSEESADTQHGAVISVDRHIGKNLKVGVGYNFTDFDDDLSDTDGTSEGWFINLVGKY